MTVIVHLIRHGEVEHHRADVGLTPAGREQALRTGAAFATVLTPGETASIAYSPVNRVRETAALIHRSLTASLGRQGQHQVVVYPPQADQALANVRFIVGPGCEPEEPSLLYEQTAQPEHDGRFSPPQAEFLRGFWSSRDPMGYWLTHPSGGVAETPAVVWDRLRTRLAGLYGTQTGNGGLATHWLLVTHSGALRVVLRQALGADPGEPRFCEAIRLERAAGPGGVRLWYHGQDAALDLSAACIET